MEHGILEVKKHLRGPNNRASLFIFDDLLETLFEIEGYMWDKDTNKPLDKDDHMMEGLYRICLLNTQYYPLVDEDFVPYTPKTINGGRDVYTGY